MEFIYPNFTDWIGIETIDYWREYLHSLSSNNPKKRPVFDNTE
jgi:hypothetical protein